MPAVFNSATAMNVSILKSTNSDFQTAQKRVSTGKSVLSANDDAVRYKLSGAIGGKVTLINAINNNISMNMKALEATNSTLNKMINELNGAQKLVMQAQALGAASSKSVTTTAAISATTLVTGGAVGNVFSITSGSGQNYKFTLTKATVAPAGNTWGEIVDGLNAAGIGVQAEFTTTGTLRFTSTNGQDFKFDGSSSQTVMDDLLGLTSGTSGTAAMTAAIAGNLFATYPTAATANETGLTVSFGGAAVGTKTTMTAAQAIAAGSILTFVDGFGVTQSLNYSAATTLGQVVTDINALDCGIKAEITNTGAGAATNVFRMRNTLGGSINVITASGDFDAAGVVGINTGTTAALATSDNAERLRLGGLYDAASNTTIKNAANNQVLGGRNLLAGNSITFNTDEFASTITMSGVSLTSLSSLGLTQPGSGWTSDANVTASFTQVTSALNKLRDFQSQFAVYTTHLQSRYDANTAYATESQLTADNLVAADVTEESAKLTALQTQQQFAVQAFSMGNQNTQGLLRMLG